MSKRNESGSHYENHQRAAELHDLAAHAHRSASEHHQQDHLTSHEQSRRALEHSHSAHEQTAQFHHAPADGSFMSDHHKIAARAHELWEARGCPQGSPEVDWLKAVEELRQR